MTFSEELDFDSLLTGRRETWPYKKNGQNKIWEGY
jgi:hypothetical protein